MLCFMHGFVFALAGVPLHRHLVQSPLGVVGLVLLILIIHDYLYMFSAIALMSLFFFAGMGTGRSRGTSGSRGSLGCSTSKATRYHDHDFMLIRLVVVMHASFLQTRLRKHVFKLSEFKIRWFGMLRPQLGDGYERVGPRQVIWF